MLYSFKYILALFSLGVYLSNAYVTKIEEFEHPETNKSYYIFYDEHNYKSIAENKEQCSKLLLYLNNLSTSLNVVTESTAFHELNNKKTASNYCALNRITASGIILQSKDGYYSSPYSSNTYISWELPLIVNFFTHTYDKFKNINLIGFDPRSEIDFTLNRYDRSNEKLKYIFSKKLSLFLEIIKSKDILKFIQNNSALNDSLNKLKKCLVNIATSSGTELDNNIKSLNKDPLNYAFLFDLVLLAYTYKIFNINNDFAFILGSKHAENLHQFLLAKKFKLKKVFNTIDDLCDSIGLIDKSSTNINTNIFWDNSELNNILTIANKYSDYTPNFRGLLQKVAAYGDVSEISSLLNFGSPINIDRDLNNNTALHAAAMLKNKNNFDYLVSQGIDTQAKNSKNLKACDYYDDSYLFKELLSIENFNDINSLKLYEKIFWKPDKVLSTNLKIIAKVLLKAIEEENHTITDMIMEFSDLTELRKHISDIKIIKFIDEIISLENLINNSINEIELKKQNNYLLLLVLKRLIHKGDFKGLVNIIKYDNIYTDLRELLADIYYNDNDRAIGEYYNNLYKNFIDQNYYDNWDIDFAEFQEKFVETIQFAKLCSNFLKNKEEYILSCLSNSEIISKNLKEKKLNSVNYRKLDKIGKECWGNIITTKKLYDELQRAIENNNDIDRITLILEKEPQIFNYIHPIDDITWTNIAKNENIEIAQLIVKYNKNFSPGLAGNPYPILPLLISYNKYFIKFLLKNGVPVDQKQYEYLTPLADTLNILADNPDKKTQKRAFSKVKTLVKFGADLNSEDITDFEARIDNEKITDVIQNIRELEKNIKNIVEKSNYSHKTEEVSKLRNNVSTILNKNYTNTCAYLKYLFYRAINTKNFLILVKLLDDQQIYNTLSYQLSKKRKNSNHLNLLREKKEKLELLNKKFPEKLNTNIKCKILEYLN